MRAVIGLASLQGAPRQGCLRFGVPLGGAIEPARLVAANRAIGNADDAVGIEVFGAIALVLDAPRADPVEVAVDGQRVWLQPGEALDVPGDQPVRYVALPGGVEPLPGFGTLPGDQLRVGDTVRARRSAASRATAPDSLRATSLGVRRGPDAVPSVFWSLLLGMRWRVYDSNRVGTRLIPDDVDLGRAWIAPDLDRAWKAVGAPCSRPLLPGFIELPPNGLPMVMGPDCPVTGGYPVIGMLEGGLGARRDGDVFAFTPVGPAPTPLNIDLGELPDEDPALYALADIANIACGGHAGDEDSIRLAVAAVHGAGGRVAAHPSYPDREHFGRLAMAMSAEAIEATVREQCGRLSRFWLGEKRCAFAVKPHGALYHAALADPAVADAVRKGARAALMDEGGDEPVFIGLPGGWTEGFADRGVQADGRLIPRGQPGALLTDVDEVIARVRALAGTVDTVCLHGDTPGAAKLARVAKETLLELAGDWHFRRVRMPDGMDRGAWIEAVAAMPDVEDVAMGDDRALVVFRDGPVELPAFTLACASRSGRIVNLPVRYDGADLDDVAEATGMTVDDVIARHLAGDYIVANLGFLPGFAYLDGLDERLCLPRRASPRPSVPAGSVAIAEGRCGVYPSASPGGWHLLGTSSIPLFDRVQGPVLRVGDRVRFVRVA